MKPSKSAKKAWTKAISAKIGDVFKPSKFHNKKVITDDGQIFDSKYEIKRYQDMLWKQQAGEIHSLTLKPKYMLIPAKRKRDGTLERACTYTPDWEFEDVKTGLKRVQDAKGMKTESYIIKRKLMLMIHNIEVEEV